METAKIKKFATEARNILKAGIAARLTGLGFDRKGQVPENNKPQLLQGGCIWNGRTLPEGFYHQWMRLYEEVQRRGVNEVYEQAAYTWFNRLVAIRILQKNGLCEPVSTYADSARTPQIVNQARQGIFPPMEAATKRHLMELLDDDTQVTEQFAVLLVAWCHANPILQRCFGTMADYTELLLPANILAENGFIDLLNHTEFITDDDFQSPELIGWLYQFYIAERKDEVFAKKGKFEADEIPAATQIFTPNWIVKYMVQNTVGRIYLDNNSYMATAMKDKWQYLVEPAEPTPAEAVLHYDELTDLRVADLACGSGHILNECFDLLYDIYITEGYTRAETITNIFTHNLTGIDLDSRAQQLSLFALTLKACQKDRSFADAHCLPHVLTMPEVDRYTYRDLFDHFCCALALDESGVVGEELDAAFTLMEEADSLGSIMKFDLSPATRAFLQTAVHEQAKQQKFAEQFKPLVAGFEVILALTEQYDALVMNPPYMYSSNMPARLLSYINDNYDEGRTDLCVTFMRVSERQLKSKGKYAMINMQSWMFLTSFCDLRKDLISNTHIDNLLHLGPHTFDELSGEVVQNVAFVVTKSTEHMDSFCFRLVDGSNCTAKEQMFLTQKNNYYAIDQHNLDIIPGKPLAYWASDSILLSFQKNDSLNDMAYSRVGMFTGDNKRFLRQWWEIDINKSSFSTSSNNQSIKSGKKWFGYNKGGGYQKWYGNLELVVNYENGGYEIFELCKQEKRNCQNYPDEYKFREGITWSGMASDTMSFRYVPNGCLFDSNKGPMIFTIPEGATINYMIAFLNTTVCNKITNVLNPTLSKQINDILNIPLNTNTNIKEISKLGVHNVNISKQDWDAHETSWDFKRNELQTIDANTYMDNINYQVEKHFKETGEHICIDPAAPQLDSIEWCVAQYHQKWERLFMQLHANEEELNRQFIDIYGLQDELTPDVPLDEITILQQGEVSIETNDLKWHDDVLIKQFLSYAAGVWMGRYRLGHDGLHIAHPNPTADELAPYDYKGHRIEIDDDGIFPLMAADSGFTDNACLRTAQFVSDVFGTDSQVANLNYIERTLGKTIEQYWIKDFWKDHKKMYQNRPIYWLFTSKKGTFQCIAYLHRMTPYTPERIRSKYLLPFIETLNRRVTDMAMRIQELSTKELKLMENLGKQIEECREYHDRLAVIAEQAIPLDLDDGVVVNYAKLGDVVAKLK